MSLDSARSCHNLALSADDSGTVVEVVAAVCVGVEILVFFGVVDAVLAVVVDVYSFLLVCCLLLLA
jgi:divalent metal cation (Fe/Co/Zn/Cd) transporter